MSHSTQTTDVARANEAVQTLEGWYTWHDFRTVNWSEWKQQDAAVRTRALDELEELHRTYWDSNHSRTGSYGQYSILGHKADLMFLHLRPTLKELNDLKNDFQKTRFADFTTSAYSYVSVVELSSYVVPPGADPNADERVQARLKPSLPQTEHVCFYPMNKRRSGEDNWYMLSMEERRNMMRSHGMIGRTYAGKVTQMICGSVGLDDWEWGVTLFAEDPLQFKKLVYEMRFDEVSARFGDFGAFYVGNTLSDEGLRNLLLVD